MVLSGQSPGCPTANPGATDQAPWTSDASQVQVLLAAGSFGACTASGTWHRPGRGQSFRLTYLALELPSKRNLSELSLSNLPAENVSPDQACSVRAAIKRTQAFRELVGHSVQLPFDAASAAGSAV